MITVDNINKPWRVLITGGAGFIGSHLAEELLRLNHHVTVIDDLSTGCFDNIAHLVEHPRFKFAIDTINNAVVMDRLVSECDMVFHLAAAVGVMLIVDKPVHTIKTNVIGTEAVLEAALRYRTKVLIASTSEVYGKGNHIPFYEDDDVVLGPTYRSRWAYAASKMVDEFLALAYYREKGLPVVIFRLFNTVGPRQTGRYGMVIPRFIQQGLQAKPLTVYGDGRQSRCFIHVQDAIEAMIELAKCPSAVGQVFNIGSCEEITITELANKVLFMINGLDTPTIADDYLEGVSMISNRYKENEERITYIPYESAYAVGFEDMHQRVPDVSKIKEYTGWVPRHSLEETLGDVLKYYSNRENQE
jgi:UDP-glucose 4-epimerase